MGKINNTVFYSIVDAIDGTTAIGSLPTGETHQFDLLATMRAVLLDIDFISVEKSTRIGQHIVGNDPNRPESSTPSINGGSKYFATINSTAATFPPTADSEVDFITKFR